MGHEQGRANRYYLVQLGRVQAAAARVMTHHLKKMGLTKNGTVGTSSAGADAGGVAAVLVFAVKAVFPLHAVF